MLCCFKPFPEFFHSYKDVHTSYTPETPNATHPLSCRTGFIAYWRIISDSADSNAYQRGSQACTFTAERCERDVGGSLLFKYWLLLTFARGTCLGASLECIAVADDSPISDETGPVAEGMCIIGILMCVLCVNVFIVIEELWEGLRNGIALTLCRSSWIALCSFFS